MFEQGQEQKRTPGGKKVGAVKYKKLNAPETAKAMEQVDGAILKAREERIKAEREEKEEKRRLERERRRGGCGCWGD